MEKSFVLNQVLNVQAKYFDVDKTKKQVVNTKSPKLQSEFREFAQARGFENLELSGIDFANGAHVGVLHGFIKKKGWDNKPMELYSS